MSARAGSFDAVKRTAARGTLALVARHLAGFTLNFTGGVLLARMLGPDAIGLYFIAFTALMILRGVIDAGVAVHLIRLPTEPAVSQLNAAFAVQQALGLAGAVALGAAGAPMLATWYGRPELAHLLVAAAIGAYAFSWQSIPVALLERRLRYGQVGMIEIAEFASFNAVAILAVWGGAGLEGLAWGMAARGLVPAVLSIRLSGFRPRLRAGLRSVSRLLASTWPIYGSNLMVYIIMLGPPVIVGKIAGARPLGLAMQAASLLGHTQIIPTILQRVGLSALARLQRQRDDFSRAVDRLVSLLIAVHVPIVMGVAALAGWWVPLLYGDSWTGMSTVIAVGALPVTLAALLTPVLSALLAAGRTRLVFWHTVLHAVLYWTTLALAAERLQALSVPIGHLVAMLSGGVLVAGYRRSHGPLPWGAAAASVVCCGALLVMTAAEAAAGRLAVPVALWLAGFAALAWGSPVSRRFLVSLPRVLAGRARG